MESNGAVKIFQRSIEKHDIRYVNYIGDSSAFSKVLESNLYPDKTIKKWNVLDMFKSGLGQILYD